MLFMRKNPAETGIDERKIAELLGTDASAMREFERSYAENVLSDDTVPENFFELNAKTASRENRKRTLDEDYDEAELANVMERIVEELLASMETDGKRISDGTPSRPPVTREELERFPKSVRPQLTGSLYSRDLGGSPSYVVVFDMYANFLNESDPRKKATFYGMFRQGLDILDLDPVLYETLGLNPNSMGFWLPKISETVEATGFFRIPKTKVVRIPLPILQLTRLEYSSLTPSTLKIVDDFCMRAFDLDVSKTYFVKTGTYSSKFDFRNAKVSGEKEVRELGEYLLFIHSQANQMASPMTKPCVYGVSTTNEWCVREFVEDSENLPTIYKGLPLRTEYRVFVDFDSDEVLGMSPYWRKDVMTKRFEEWRRTGSPHDFHDLAVYMASEKRLDETYGKNAEKVRKEVERLLPKTDMTGQWSIDVMQDGDDFWLIDMALAENSALRDCVPKERLERTTENWIPKFPAEDAEGDES